MFNELNDFFIASINRHLISEHLTIAFSSVLSVLLGSLGQGRDFFAGSLLSFRSMKPALLQEDNAIWSQSCSQSLMAASLYHIADMKSPNGIGTSVV